MRCLSVPNVGRMEGNVEVNCAAGHISVLLIVDALMHCTWQRRPTKLATGEACQRDLLHRPARAPVTQRGSLSQISANVFRTPRCRVPVYQHAHAHLLRAEQTPAAVKIYSRRLVGRGRDTHHSFTASMGTCSLRKILHTLTSHCAHGDGLVRVTQAPSPITITSELATASRE